MDLLKNDLLVTDIAGTLGVDWLKGFNEEVQNMMETEKAKYYVRQSAIAQEEHAIGKQTIDSLGQKVAAIDSKTYFRWLHEDPDFWNDRSNVKRFLQDNPECKVPGFWHGIR